MRHLTIKIEVDGKALAQYEFDCDDISQPQQLSGGPITIYFDPKGDGHHQLEINSLPGGRSNTIKYGSSEKICNTTAEEQSSQQTRIL
jgi:hypothetical protein